MHFRHAVPEDAEAILRLYRRQIGRPGVVWDDEYPAMENIRYDLSENGLYVGLDDTGSLIAAASAVAWGDMDEQYTWDPSVGKWCDLARICVDPSHAGQGIAGRILRFVIEDTRARGFEGMRLLVAHGNTPAERLYASAGFVSRGPCEAFGHTYDRRELVYK